MRRIDVETAAGASSQKKLKFFLPHPKKSPSDRDFGGGALFGRTGTLGEVWARGDLYSTCWWLFGFLGGHMFDFCWLEYGPPVLTGVSMGGRFVWSIGDTG